MVVIQSIHARQIFDSRGNPTVEVDLRTDKGLFRAAVPSGASTGIYEALEMRDKDPKAYHGKGVSNAVNNVNNIIAKHFVGKDVDVANQEAVDKEMLDLDGTDNKSKLGANAILGVSLAMCKAGAAHKGVPLYRHIADLAGNADVILPVPAFNVINGGSHAGNKLAMQEFMILPTGASSFAEAMKMGTETYHHLKAVIKSKYGQDACNVGDEGGFAPNILNNFEGLDLLVQAIEKAGYTGRIKIGMDVAASEFCKEGPKYDLDFKNPNSDPSAWLSSDQLFGVYKEFIEKYPVVTIEDAFDQDDWDAWTKMNAGVDIQLVGDDLLVTNPKRVQEGIDRKACNCLLLKVNQIGSVTESIKACKMSQAQGWGVMVSHRSGETEDTFIADLVVGLCTGQIKTGAPCRSERLAKYNQILRIEEELGGSAKYAGANFRNPKAAGSKIVSLKARQIFDSRGNPTVEVDLQTDKGLFRAAVPSGASTGIYEALEMRDKDPKAYHGKGVSNAVNNVNNIIAKHFVGKDVDVANQEAVDKEMLDLDGTDNKSKLGANAILGVSLAMCKAGAAHKGVPLYRHIADLAGNADVILPVPAFNVINGGSHAGNKLAMQEFMILPTGASSFAEAMKMGTETYHHLKAVIKSKYGQDACNVGDEGGFAPNILNNFEGLDLLVQAIEKAGYTGRIKIGMDVAASEFCKEGPKYDLDFKNPNSDPSAWLSSDQLFGVYKEFIEKYPVVTIEDAFDQDDWDAWTKMNAGVDIQLVGDDLLVTNPKRVQEGIDRKACNCLLLKVNQIGSVTESIKACKMSQAQGWGVMVSHRSGETEDTFIADLVVGLCTGQIKTGAPCRSERLAKYNQILRIEEELGGSAKYAGANFRNPKAAGSKIVSLKARQIFDSRGNPTVEVDLQTDKGLFRAAVPSGASTGIYEALEMRDKDPKAYHGKGVMHAVNNVNKVIAPALVGKTIDLTNQKAVDQFMLNVDGTENKSKLGANAILGVSLAVCKAGAAQKGAPLYRHIADLAGNKNVILPVPAFNVINGGSHAGNKLAMQEFMILPTGAASFAEAMKMGTETYHHLKAVIKSKYGQDACNVGDEGGFAPNIQNNFEGLELLRIAIEKAGYTGRIHIGMDVAASEFCKQGKYDLDFKNPNSDPAHWLSSDQLFGVYKEFIEKYPVVTIEDAFDQDDWDAWTKMNVAINIQLVGDDLLVTNPKRVQEGINRKACNCLLLKVNQIGSVTESIEACKMSQAQGWGVMVSHRSGETEDTFIADLVVGLCTGQIKTGAPCRSERLSKYNQILRIEEELGGNAKYAGANFRKPQV